MLRRRWLPLRCATDACCGQDAAPIYLDARRVRVEADNRRGPVHRSAEFCCTLVEFAFDHRLQNGERVEVAGGT